MPPVTRELINDNDVSNRARNSASATQHGVKHGERIIFAHPNKLPSHIKYSSQIGRFKLFTRSLFLLIVREITVNLSSQPIGDEKFLSNIWGRICRFNT